MAYIFYIIFGLIPSIVWLLFYLRKDAHPEPNRIILKIFFLGAGSAVFAAFLESGFFEAAKILPLPAFLLSVVNIFFGVAFIEEAAKYLVVRCCVLNNAEFDEPIDAMLYMIIAALGFAAMENTLILWFNQRPFSLFETFTWSAVRFWGATFLHALSSGTLGYFLALSCFKQSGRKKENKKQSPRLLFYGLTIATLLHGLYNFSIMKIEGSRKILLPVVILLGSALFVSFGLQKLKRLNNYNKVQNSKRF